MSEWLVVCPKTASAGMAPTLACGSLGTAPTEGEAGFGTTWVSPRQAARPGTVEQSEACQTWPLCTDLRNQNPLPRLRLGGTSPVRT